MKKIFLMALFVLSQFINAQEVTKNLGDFNFIRVFDQIDVLLVRSSENKIVIKGPEAENVEIVTKNNKLKIRMKFTKLLQGDNVDVTLYYKGTIEQIDASEGSYVSSQDTFKATAFELNTKEGAQIKLNLDVQKLKSRTGSGSQIHVSGKAANHDATVVSGGELHAKDLITSQTEVSISAGGEAEVYATDFVDAKTTAGGEIDIYGNPQQVNKKTVVGGDITIHN